MKKRGIAAVVVASTDDFRVGAVNNLKVRDLTTGKVYPLPQASTRNEWSIGPRGDHATVVHSFDATARKWTLWKRFDGMTQFEGAR